MDVYGTGDVSMAVNDKCGIKKAGTRKRKRGGNKKKNKNKNKNKKNKNKTRRGELKVNFSLGTNNSIFTGTPTNVLPRQTS